MSRIKVKDGRKPAFYWIAKEDSEAIIEYFKKHPKIKEPSLSKVLSVNAALAWCASNAGKDQFPASYQELANKSGCSRRIVIAAIRILIKVGTLTVKKRRFKKSIYELASVCSDGTSNATELVTPQDEGSNATELVLVTPGATIKETKNSLKNICAKAQKSSEVIRFQKITNCWPKKEQYQQIIERLKDFTDEQKLKESYQHHREFHGKSPYNLQWITDAMKGINCYSCKPANTCHTCDGKGEFPVVDTDGSTKNIRCLDCRNKSKRYEARS